MSFLDRRSVARAMLPFQEFCGRFSIPLFDWQREAFGSAASREDDRFVYRLVGISAPRGDGKSHGAAAIGLWRLVAGRPRSHVLSTALDLEGARVVLEHARQMVRRHPVLSDGIEIRADGLTVAATGSRWTITSREHPASRGQHPDLVVYDEAGWAKDDELFASLLAGQASVNDPLMLVVSTVGRRQSGPLWTIKQLADSGDPHVHWHWHGENRSPKVTSEFLSRQRRILMPAQFAREHENRWVDAADSFTTSAEVDAAMSHDWAVQYVGEKGKAYDGFVDIGVVGDPTVIALGHAQEHLLFIDVLLTFEGSRAQPVQLADVEATIRDLSRRFHVRRWRVESWQGIAAVQSLQRLGISVELFTPTAKAHAEEWPLLAQQLSSRTLVLPRHDRLREELLNLVVELGSQGVRVIDRGRVHQDHAVAVRGVCASLMSKKPVDPDFVRLCLSIGKDAPRPFTQFPMASDGLPMP